MAKTWEQLTPAQKIEDLRKDVVRLFAAISSANRDVMGVSSHVNELARTVSKLEALASPASKRKGG